MLREYVDEQHQLTPWGEMLRVVLGGVGPTKEQAEAAFVAVELIKLGHLNTDGLFSGLGFNQPRGSGEASPSASTKAILTQYRD